FAFAPVSRPINSEKRPADQTLTDRFGAFSLCRAGNLAGELAAEFASSLCRKAPNPCITAEAKNPINAKSPVELLSRYCYVSTHTIICRYPRRNTRTGTVAQQDVRDAPRPSERSGRRGSLLPRIAEVIFRALLRVRQPLPGGRGAGENSLS